MANYADGNMEVEVKKEGPIFEAILEIDKELSTLSKRITKLQEEGRELVDRKIQLQEARDALSPLIKTVAQEVPSAADVQEPTDRNVRRTVLPRREGTIRAERIPTEGVVNAIEALLRLNPERWYTLVEMRNIVMGKVRVPSHASFSTMMAPSNIKEPSWLRREKIGRVVYFSLHPDQGGQAVSQKMGGE